MIIDNLPVDNIHIGTGFFISFTPSSQANYFVIFRPVGKGIIGSLIYDYASSVFYKIYKICFCLLRPFVTIVIKNHNIVWFKIDNKTGHVFSLRGRNFCFNDKYTRLFQD